MSGGEWAETNELKVESEKVGRSTAQSYAGSKEHGGWRQEATGSKDQEIKSSRDQETQSCEGHGCISGNVSGGSSQ